MWANGHLHGHQVPGRVVNHRDKAGHWPEHQTGGDGLPNQNGGYNHRLEWLQSLKGDRKQQVDIGGKHGAEKGQGHSTPQLPIALQNVNAHSTVLGEEVLQIAEQEAATFHSRC